MKKLVKIVIAICILVILGVLIGKHYNNLKIERFNKYIDNANKAINNQEYKVAEVLLDKAKSINRNAPIIYEKLDEIQFDQEQNQLYSRGMDLEEMNNYYEAINVFKEISPKAEELSKNSEIEIKKCKDAIIKNYVVQANQVLEQGNTEYAKYLVTKMENVDKDNPEIGIIKTKIKNYEAFKNK
ncbi:hypothetical protein [Clostridium sp. B9]|uniref:hypothetical protein n=1 Tax=Clostridium sp. B9 TaxID=3423224 RepID=UPI003D2F422D